MTQQERGPADSGVSSDKSGAGPGERVGLVLAGAAARGPFQAGALAELLPSLIAEGHRPVVLLGTSSGAITAGLLAQFADQSPAAAGQGVVDTWTGFGDVFTNPLYTPKPAAAIAARFVDGSFADRFIDPVDALLDTTPLRQHSATVFTPARVAANTLPGGHCPVVEVETQHTHIAGSPVGNLPVSPVAFKRFEGLRQCRGPPPRPGRGQGVRRRLRRQVAQNRR
jgi:hypothetical protein